MFAEMATEVDNNLHRLARFHKFAFLRHSKFKRPCGGRFQSAKKLSTTHFSPSQLQGVAIREIQPDATTAWGPLAIRALGFAHCQRAHCEGRSTVGLISKNLSAVNFTGSSKSKTNSTCQSLLLLSETSAHEVGISAIVDGILR